MFAYLSSVAYNAPCHPSPDPSKTHPGRRRGYPVLQVKAVLQRGAGPICVYRWVAFGSVSLCALFYSFLFHLFLCLSMLKWFLLAALNSNHMRWTSLSHFLSVTLYLLHLGEGNGVGGSCQVQLISNHDNTSPTPFFPTPCPLLHTKTLLFPAVLGAAQGCALCGFWVWLCFYPLGSWARSRVKWT